MLPHRTLVSAVVAIAIVLIAGFGCKNRAGETPGDSNPVTSTPSQVPTPPPALIEGQTEADVVDRVRQHLSEVAAADPDLLVVAQVSLQNTKSFAELESMATAGAWTPTSRTVQAVAFDGLVGATVHVDATVTWTDFVASLPAQIEAMPSINSQLVDPDDFDQNVRVSDIIVMARASDLSTYWAG